MRLLKSENEKLVENLYKQSKEEKTQSNKELDVKEHKIKQLQVISIHSNQ